MGCKGTEVWKSSLDRSLLRDWSTAQHGWGAREGRRGTMRPFPLVCHLIFLKFGSWTLVCGQQQVHVAPVDLTTQVTVVAVSVSLWDAVMCCYCLLVMCCFCLSVSFWDVVMCHYWLPFHQDHLQSQVSQACSTEENGDFRCFFLNTHDVFQNVQQHRWQLVSEQCLDAFNQELFEVHCLNNMPKCKCMSVIVCFVCVSLIMFACLWCVCVSLNICACLRVSVCVFVCNLSLCLCILCVWVCVCAHLCSFVCLCVFVHVCVGVSLCAPVSCLCVSVSLCMFVCVCDCLCLYVGISSCVFACLSLPVSVCFVSLCVSVYLGFCLCLFLCCYMCLHVFINVCLFCLCL